MANKRNDNRNLPNVSKIYITLAIVIVVLISLVLLKVMPLWLAITSAILFALLFFMQLGAMKQNRENSENANSLSKNETI